MKNKKQVLTTLGAVALTAVVAIGGTLALLSNVTETKTNTFSSSKNITTEIEEKFNPSEAGKYTPGKVITKEPTITNTSEEEAIWVAVSLDYTNGASSITADEFNKYAQVQGMNTTDWKQIKTADAGQELYLYKTTLAKGTSTSAIFTGVKVNAGIQEVKKTGKSGSIIYTRDEEGNLIDVKDNTTLVDETTYYDENGQELDVDSDAVVNGLPTFEIVVKGYAVQAADVDEATATEELTKLANSSMNYAFK